MQSRGSGLMQSRSSGCVVGSGLSRPRLLATPAQVLLRRPSLLGAVASPQPSPSWNPVEVVKREQGLQSNKLPGPVRDAVCAAVEELRFRVTVGDVAARAGVKLQEADDALKALAYDSKATLEVGEQGDIVYTFPRDFQGAIRARSVLLSVLPAMRTLARGAAYLSRVAFGTTLFASVAVVWLAIAAIMLSGRRDDDRRGGGDRVYHNSGYGGMRLYFNLADLLSFWDPQFGANNHRRVAGGEQLNLLESIFSFVWGDGDPNVEYDTKRWAALGRLIQARGGVVAAEEMAPFLDPPETPKPSQQGAYKDESFVLPALIRFGGEPEVDAETGTILYRFPALQASGVTSEWVGSRAFTHRALPPHQQAGSAAAAAAAAAAPVASYSAAQEQAWELTAAPATNVLGAVLLGVFNLVGVLTLQGMLRDAHAAYALREWGLGWVGALLPALQLYAAAFFAVPVLRSLLNAWRNAGIAARNGARLQATMLLQQGAGWLQRKLQAARQQGASRTVRQSDVVFSTAKDTAQQMNEKEAREWDRQFAQSAQVFARSQPLPDDPQAPIRLSGQPRQQQRDSNGMGRRDFDGNWL